MSPPSPAPPPAPHTRPSPAVAAPAAASTPGRDSGHWFPSPRSTSWSLLWHPCENITYYACQRRTPASRSSTTSALVPISTVNGFSPNSMTPFIKEKDRSCLKLSSPHCWLRSCLAMGSAMAAMWGIVTSSHSAPVPS